METKQELLNAMKVIKEHCKTIQPNLDEHFLTSCNEMCPIGEKCELYLETDYLPEEWDLEEGEHNE